MLGNGKNRLAAPIVLLGAALDTANLGCSALSLSVILGIQQRLPSSQVAVGDFGRGFRTRTLDYGEVQNEITLFGSVNTRRVYRTDSIYGMAFCSFLGGLGHPVISMYRDAVAVLDISGGDSFSDIYGMKFFRSNVLRKYLALRESKSLILLPQTYGPYNSKFAKAAAQRVVRESTMAWSRDDHSFDVLREMLGQSFDPSRHRAGVDVAFSLPVICPADATIAEKLDWFEDVRTPLVGINVSGLLLNRPGIAAEQYGLKANYREVILLFVRMLLKESDARILLVPHVVSPPGHYESDISACQMIADALGSEHADRVSLSPIVYDPCEVKWIISQCDWFCGTRMHSTVAALSSGVPTAAISYSPKTLGVFETCAQGSHVSDPRKLDTEQMVSSLWQSWLERKSAHETLADALPETMRRAQFQMDEIVASCDTTSAARKLQVY